MRFGPPVQFVHRPDGHNLAYQVLGDAPLDLVLLFGWPTHLGLLWENPSLAGFLHKLASFSRLILVDRLSNGLSDRGPGGQTFEDELDDVRLVLDAVASQRAAFFGCHIGGRLALLFAATYPERTRAVVTFAAHPATLPADDYPWGSTPEQREWLLTAIKRGPPDPAGLLPRVAPRESADPSFRHWWRMFYQSATTAPEAYDMVASLGPVDIRRLLGSVRVPTLLLHRTGDQWVDVGASRYMAERLPDARLVELPGDDHFPFLGDQDAVVVLTQEFLTGVRPAVDPDRVLATVLFTDIVDSTRLATELGDQRWHRTLEQHNAVVRANLARFRGRDIKTTGDGFLAVAAYRAANTLDAMVGHHSVRYERFGWPPLAWMTCSPGRRPAWARGLTCVLAPLVAGRLAGPGGRCAVTVAPIPAPTPAAWRPLSRSDSPCRRQSSSCSWTDSPQDRTHHLHGRPTRQCGSDATTRRDRPRFCNCNTDQVVRSSLPLQRPSSRRRRHDGNRGTGLTHHPSQN
jgi:pimeloyl-ACP methyl ester carboxylesterase